jgi:hypothetical protein
MGAVFFEGVLGNCSEGALGFGWWVVGRALRARPCVKSVVGELGMDSADGATALRAFLHGGKSGHPVGS